MSRLAALKVLLTQRLQAAARADLFGHLETTISGYEKEIDRQRELLDLVSGPASRLRAAVVQDGGTTITFSRVPVKSEEDDEEKPQSSQLHQSQTGENREAEHLKTEADGEDCGGPEPARNPDPDSPLQAATHDNTSHSEPETDDTWDWEETREPQSGSNPLQNNQVPVSDQECNSGTTSGSSSEGAASFGHKEHLQKHTGVQTGEILFSCSVCGKRFREKGNLKEHFTSHTEDKPFSCSVCGRRFAYNGHLRNHMTVHTGKPFSCSVCGKRFMVDGNLRQHMKIHTGETPVSCSVCGKRFRQTGHLTEHFKIHTGEKPFSCLVCGKGFIRKAHLTEHLTVHTEKEEQEELWTSQEGPEEADVTTITFSRVPVKSEDDDEEKPQSSQLHQSQTEQMETGADGEDCGGPIPARTSDPDPDTEKRVIKRRPASKKRLKCSLCFKTFKLKYNLSRHMLCHTGEKPFSCSVCGRKFTHISSLGCHVRCHAAEYPFHCLFCYEMFTQEAFLCTHIKSHKEKPFCCSICGQRFSLKRVLLSHKRSHKEEESFDRSICGKKFTQKTSPQNHTRSHSAKKPISCSACDKVFRTKKDLISHAKIHTRLNAFRCNNCGIGLRGTQLKTHTCPKRLKCSKCDITFAKKYLLRNHMRMHRGKEQFSCTICGRKMLCRSHLEVHMRTHTGEKPFSCSICGKTFSQKGIVKQHMAIHSGVKPFSCSVCGKRFVWQFQVRRHKCVVKDSWKRVGFNEEDCGRPGPSRNADPSFETEDDVDVGFWKETRQHLPGFTYRKSTNVSVKAETNTDERPDSDFCKQSGTNDSHTLQTHNQWPTGEKPLSCLFCGKEFMTGGYLTRHTSVHTGEKLLDCIVCKKSFPLESQLLIHECGNGFGPEQPISCSICNSGFSDSESLVTHMRIHTGQAQFCCSICGKTFAWRRHLTKHMELHTQKRPYSCSLCDRRFTQLWKLNYHNCASLQSSQLQQNQTEQMETGGPEPARNPDADTHLKPETEDSSETEHSAEDWSETREPQSGLKSVEPDEFSERLSCSTCGEQFTESGDLDQHMAVHTGVHKEAKQEDPPEPPHIKEEQEELWTSQEGPEEADVNTITFSRVPVKSEEDDEEKPQSSQLHQSQTEENREAEHLKTEADGEDCGGPEPARNPDPDSLLEPTGGEKMLVSFKTENSADSDFWKETVERSSEWDSGRNTVSCSDEKEPESVEPNSDDSADSDFWKDIKDDIPCQMNPAFVCSVCGQTCLYKSHLKIHMRTHTGEKPFMCPVCGKRYAHKASMQSHMGVHAVNKQHACDVCDRSFVWYTELKYHQCVAKTSQGAPP